MNRRWMLPIAIIGLAAQFGVMGWMILQREVALRNGVACRFRTAPVDPYDAFRGRYVALNLSEADSQQLCDREYARGQRIYAVIGEGTDGYSRIDRLTTHPEPEDVCIRTRVRHCWPDYRQLPAGTNDTAQAAYSPGTYVPTGRYHVRLALPFDRFYMEEKLAPEAEKAYRDAGGSDRQEGVLVVRVWRGLGVIEDLELGGRSIRDVARERLDR
ncbi:MAG: GDYXXLXY domain-containing protein [Kiritimatiellia bacterium]|jgi:hypothetical protein